MAQVLVQIPDEMLRELDKVAPGSSRKRSRFLRLAIQKALMELRDVGTRAAYAAMPDDDVDVFDARVWDEWKPAPPRKSPKRRAVRRGARTSRAK